MEIKLSDHAQKYWIEAVLEKLNMQLFLLVNRGKGYISTPEWHCSYCGRSIINRTEGAKHLQEHIFYVETLLSEL